MVRTGITAGAFDLCHAGHLIFLAECGLNVDRMIVCLQTNPQIDRPHKNVPCETMFERWVRLKSCRHVDEIIPYDTERDLVNILNSVTWHNRFLDSSYSGQRYTGWNIRPDDHIFIGRKHDYSSTNLRNHLKGVA